MSFFKIILWAFVLYYLYKFIFNLVVPVTKVAKEMKSKVEKMQSMQQEQQYTQQYTVHQQPTKTNTTPDKADYIEFEEIKS
jgi:hypothetical protein